MRITWKCYCGNREVEFRPNEPEGNEGRHCELSCCPTGAYNESPYWDKKRDEADDRKVVSGQKYNVAMANVVPLKDKKKARR